MHLTGTGRERSYNRILTGGLLLTALLYITVFVYGDLVTVNIMEARNFITAREIVQSQNWLLPTMNGELRIAKPPLPSWITALFMIGAGTDADLAVNRLPAGLSALLLALFAGLLVRRITGDPKEALLFLVILATSYMFMLSARKNSWDIFSITFMTGAVWALAEVFSRDRGRGRTGFLVLASLFMTGAFYSKGPVPFWVMLAPFLISHGLSFGWTGLRENSRGLAGALFLCAVISAVWPVLVYFNAPHTAAAVASKESQSWFTEHTEPVWYYLLHFPEIVGIWIFHLLYGLAAPFIKKNWTPQEKFFLFWFILTIVFISVFPEKKVRYLLPAVVPAAMVVTNAIRRLNANPGLAGRIVYGAFSGVTGCFFLLAAGMMIYYSPDGIRPFVGVPLLIGATGFLLGAYVKRRYAGIPFIAAAGLCFCLVLLPPLLAGRVGHYQATPFMYMRDVPEYQGTDFYSPELLSAEVIWASGRIITPLIDQPLTDLMSKGRPFFLLAEKALIDQPPGIRLVDTIRTDKRTYCLYRFDGEE